MEAPTLDPGFTVGFLLQLLSSYKQMQMLNQFSLAFLSLFSYTVSGFDDFLIGAILIYFFITKYLILINWCTVSFWPQINKLLRICVFKLSKFKLFVFFLRLELLVTYL